MIDSDKIIAEEYRWIYDNEPTFQINGNVLTGKVGRSPNGESILISISIPEYYPVIKPDVRVITKISHPNIDDGMNLSLQMLDNWDPQFRLKDIIADSRRLFIKSKRSIETKETIQVQDSGSTANVLEGEILNLQRQLSDLNKQITTLKSERLQKAGIQQLGTVKITEKADLLAMDRALADLLELLEIKFEDADIDQTDFFRLYRKYIKEKYISSHKLAQIEVGKNELSEKETKRPIRH